jgi:hypothetical protein
MKIEGLRKCRGRPTIYELPGPLRFKAQQWLSRLIGQAKSRGRPLHGWYLAILCGQAKRLALNPPTAAWGRSMRARKGGYATQRRYRMEGRDPAAKARWFLKFARAKRKKEKEKAMENAKFLQNRENLQNANERYIERVSALLSKGKAPFA